MTDQQPRTLAELEFIRARVVAEWVTDRIPSGPLLSERAPKPRPETCRRGHTAWVQHASQWRCAECERLRHSRKRLRRVGQEGEKP